MIELSSNSGLFSLYSASLDPYKPYYDRNALLIIIALNHSILDGSSELTLVDLSTLCPILKPKIEPNISGTKLSDYPCSACLFLATRSSRTVFLICSEITFLCLKYFLMLLFNCLLSIRISASHRCLLRIVLKPMNRIKNTCSITNKIVSNSASCSGAGGINDVTFGKTSQASASYGEKF
jgi:hypothetical protein